MPDQKKFRIGQRVAVGPNTNSFCTEERNEPAWSGTITGIYDNGGIRSYNVQPDDTSELPRNVLEFRLTPTS